jgi:hypothetical protein
MAAVTWSGMDDLMTALRTLPERLAGEAQGIVKGAADDAQTAIAAGYPSRTGDLKRRLRLVTKATGPYGVGYQVRNTSPIAWIFESGSQARHTRLGANRGAMPPGHVFIPAVVRARTQMYRALKAMLEREGLLVSGDAP